MEQVSTCATHGWHENSGLIRLLKTFRFVLSHAAQILIIQSIMLECFSLSDMYSCLTTNAFMLKCLGPVLSCDLQFRLRPLRADHLTARCCSCRGGASCIPVPRSILILRRLSVCSVFTLENFSDRPATCPGCTPSHPVHAGIRCRPSRWMDFTVHTLVDDHDAPCVQS